MVLRMPWAESTVIAGECLTCLSKYLFVCVSLSVAFFVALTLLMVVESNAAIVVNCEQILVLLLWKHFT